jgi:hypothetical protein
LKKLHYALALLILIAAFALAQVFKWVDEEGNVHFGDKPPEKADVEELVIPEGPSQEEIEAAEEALRERLESRESRDRSQADVERERWSEDYSEGLMTEERFNRCVEARYQVIVLERRGRAFKLSPNWTRHYLEDEDRPAEMSRLENLVDEYCDTDAKSVQKQNQRLLELKDALNIRCIAARERLQKSTDPQAGIDARQVREAQEYIELKCPDTKLHDLWIADWIFVR